jgi:nucleoside-diphosphate-sugar epimerase
MSQKRILITGAAGFLGSHLCDRFIKEGYYVMAMDNLITGDLMCHGQHLRGQRCLGNHADTVHLGRRCLEQFSGGFCLDRE